MSDELPPRPSNLFHKVTVDEQIAEVHRELWLRHRVYERKIAAGEMSRKSAEAHMLPMFSAYDSLVWLRDNRAAVLDAHKHIKSLMQEPAVKAVMNEFPDASVDEVRDIEA